jgi:hypothetical protein
MGFNNGKSLFEWWPGTESNCRHGDFQTAYRSLPSVRMNRLLVVSTPTGNSRKRAFRGTAVSSFETPRAVGRSQYRTGDNFHDVSPSLFLNENLYH